MSLRNWSITLGGLWTLIGFRSPEKLLRGQFASKRVIVWDVSSSIRNSTGTGKNSQHNRKLVMVVFLSFFTRLQGASSALAKPGILSSVLSKPSPINSNTSHNLPERNDSPGHHQT